MAKRRRSKGKPGGTLAALRFTGPAPVGPLPPRPTGVGPAGGRPQTLTSEILDEYLRRMRCGMTEPAISADPNMPDMSTIHDLLSGRMPAPAGFPEAYAQAQRDQVAAFVTQMPAIADDTEDHPEKVASARVRIGTRQWLASKILPDRFGDRLQVAGDPRAPLVVAAARTRVTERLTALAESLKRGPDCDMVESPQLVEATGFVSPHVEVTCDVPSPPVGVPARAGR